MVAARERNTKMIPATVITSKSTGTFAASRIWAFPLEIGCKNGVTARETNPITVVDQQTPSN